jgi:hypothetical protein
MTAQSGARLLLLLLAAGAAAGCDPHQPQPSPGSTTPAYERVAEQRPLDPGERPVTIGELGPNFPACYAMARFRDRVVSEDEAVPVRAAPSDQARETSRLAASAQFFICTRSHDQRWFAVVWDEAEGASRRCGVSQPVSARRDYRGPCRSGWIPSSVVRLESGIIHKEPVEANSTG